MSIDVRILFLIFSYMIGASLILLTVQFASSNRSKFRPLWEMVGYEVLALIAVFLPAYLGVEIFAIFIILIALMTQQELFNGTKITELRWIAATGGIFILAIAYFEGENRLMSAVALSFMGIMLAALNAKNLMSVFLSGFSLIYPCGMLAYVILLRQLPNGFVWVVVLYGIIEIHDGFANMLGRIFGKRKIFGQLSPNKSIEGSLAGFLMTLTAIPVMKLWIFPEEPLLNLIGLVVLVDACTIAGDMVASKFKRLMGIKDSGNIIPYRGGFLDIYDALIFAAVPFYLYVQQVIY